MRRIYRYKLPKVYKGKLDSIQSEWSNNRVLRQENPTWNEKIWRKEYRTFLQRIQGGRCAFCETFTAGGSNGEVEHYLYKKRYIHHKFRWDNWILSCPSCNRAKGTRDVLAENWLDSRNSNPTDAFSILPTGYIVPRIKLSESPVEYRMIKNVIEGADLNCTRTNRPKLLISSRKAAITLLEEDIKQYQLVKTFGIQKIIDAQKKIIINRCTEHEQDFTGILLSWLRKRVEDGEIEEDIYIECQNRFELNKPKPSNVFA